MDDSHPGRGMPVLSDPWMKAHTPTTDTAPTAEPKKRRSWFCGQDTPAKSVSGATRRLEEHKEEEIPTLQITHFTKKVMLSFDDVRLGSTKVLTLRLENPHDYPQEVELEKFPFQKGFSLPETVWEVEGNQSIDFPVSWTPSDEKNVRELVTFKCEGAFRLQLIILGTVKVPKKKKNVNRRSTFTARKGQVVQSRRSVAVTSSRRETFVQKKSPRSQPYPDVGKENKITVVGKKADTPGTRKARARSVGTVLERILTPRKTLPQGETERVMVGDKVCTFSPQLTAKAMMEITGESPFADGKMQTEPRKDTLVLCDGMSPLLQSTGNQDLRKAALEKEAGPLRRLSKEQMSTVTKSSSPASRLDDDGDAGLQPHQLAFLMPDEAEISKIMATPASSVFEPLANSMGARLSSTRIDDSINPAAAPFFLTEDDQPHSSIEDDSLEEVKPQTKVFDEVEEVQKDKIELPGDVQDIGKDDRVQTSEPEQQNVEESVFEDTQPEECTESCDVVLDSEPEPVQSMAPSDTADGAEEYVQSDELPVPSAEREPCVILDDNEDKPASSSVPDSVHKGQSWRISLGGGSEASTSPKDAARVQKPRSKQEGSSWRVSLGSIKRSPGARPAAQKRPISRPSSRATTSAPSSKPAPPLKAKEDFTIHKSAVTGCLNRKRLSDPISDPAVPKKRCPSPEQKTSAKETLRSNNASINKSRSSLSSSRQFNRTVALRKAAATGKAVPAKAPASSKPKGKPKAPRAVKGVPMAKLQLIKPTRSALPRHPLPFAAKNIFYDERWMEKQDRAFTCWLNYVLTPDIDTPKDPNKNVKIDAHLLCLEGASKVGPAPSREDISLRAYTAKRRLNRLRRGACIVFQSEPVIRVMMKVEAEVEKGRIIVREDKMLHADLGIKQELLNLILCYNPLWLRIGLETIYGELLPIQDNSDVYGMSRFVVTRLLGNPDIAAVHAHPTVPNLFGPGYQSALAQFTLKKFLMLVFFLDRAKLTRLIDHDPCLFCKDAQVKSSRDILLEFSRRYLKGEGDITRHLSFLGYSVTHVQRPLDEFDFAVNKLSVDLRCGVRLARVVELLTQNWTLSRELRVPAISRLQKIHNIEVAFKMLKDRGIDVEGGGLNERVIVDGHREKTLELLWRIIFHYQVGVMLNEEQIREEIAFLTKHRKLKEKMSALKVLNQGPAQPSLDGPHLYFKSPQLMLLMDWCKAVCSFYDMQIENFTVSFCDGRALCLLIHHYHPSLLPYERINQNTTLMQFQREEREDDLNASCDEGFNGTWSQTFSPSTGKETDQEKLLANERKNFKLLYEKVNELGGVPMMVRSADMSNTIPDEKVVITYVSYLCARLLDLRQETRAARTIQLAWRAHHLRKEQKMRMVKEKAASRIQSAVRSFLLKRREERIGGAVLKIQTAIRGFLARQMAKTLRREAAVRKQSQAAILIQAVAKGFLVRRAISRQHRAATVIQLAVRGHMIRARVARMQRAASAIQGWYRSQQETRTARKIFVELRTALVRVQAIWRGILVRRMVKKMKAARAIQAIWRGYNIRRVYLKQRAAAIILQSHYRRHRDIANFRKLRGAVIKIQALYRSKVMGEKQRFEYCALRDATVVMQKIYRGRLGRRDVHRIRSAVKIQAAFRGYQQRAVYTRLRSSAVLIQSLVKGVQSRKRFTKLRQAAIVLQTRYRAVLLGREVCREYNIQRGAAITIQSAVRCYQKRQGFLKTKHSIVILQSAVRRNLCLKKYRQLRQASIIMQKRYRAVLLGREVCREYNIRRGAAITIQSAVRCYKERQCFLKTKRSMIILQSAVRGYLALNRYRQLRKAAVVMQKRYRAVLLGRHVCREYNITRGAVITIQSAVRCYQERQQFLKTKHSIIILQSAARRYLALKNYRQLRQATVVMQKRYRAVLLGRQVCREYNITRGAAITIQSAVRCYQERKRFIQTKHSIIILQSVVRRYLALKNYRQLRKAAVVMQKRYRAVLVGRHVCREYNITRGAAITIQSAVRCYRERQQFLKTKHSIIILQSAVRRYLALKNYRQLRQATVVMQKRYRAVLLGREVCREYIITRGAAITIQSAVRCYQERQRFVQTKTRIVLLQSAVRRYLTLKNYRQLRQAARVMQERYRAILLGRSLRREYCIAKGAAITLQATWKRNLARREFLRMKSAAIKLQSAVRCHFARQSYIKLQEATVILQRRFRAALQTKQAVVDFCYARGAIITLQAAFRGYLQKKDYQRTRAAVITLQASTRCYLVRKEFCEKKSATILLQRHFRALIAGRELQANYRSMRAAAITLQASYRCHIQRKWYLKQRSSAIMIQAELRKMLARKRYLQLRDAAIVLQTRYRARILMHQLTQDYNTKRSSAILLQSLYRGHVQRKNFLHQKSSAVVIQARVRGYLQHRSYMRVQWAVRTLQERCRAWMTGRACAEEYYLARGRIITIQALYRGYTARKILRAQKAAATTIQANFRCYVARKRYASIKHAVRVLETRLTAQTLARQTRETFLKTKAGIISMQSLYRGFAVRKELARQHRAATVIQSSYKRFIARSRYLHLQKAALVLQAHYRSLQLGRAVCKEYNIQRGAAITIQAAYRGYCQRKVLSQQRQAAIVIQAAVRAHQARVSYVSLRNAAVVVQKHFRAQLLSKRINMEYNIMRGAAITLQAAYRGHLQRKSLARQHFAATQIQAAFRGYTAKRWYSSMCRAAVFLQTRYRANKLAHIVQNDYHITRGAAITLQAAYRGHLQRKLLTLQHSSATQIQASFRGFVARKNYLQMCHAAGVLQKHLRALKLGRKVQQEYHIMVGAIVTIQAAFRGLVARRELHRQHKMATRIQACFRGYVQRISYQKISSAALVIQRHFRALRLGQRVRERYILCQSSAIKIQAFYRCHTERKAFVTQKQSAVKIQAMVRGYLGFTFAKRFRQERTIAAMAIQRQWRANGLRDQQVRCYNIQRGAAITIQAAARTFLVRQSIKKWHKAATCIQSFYRCHRAVQSYRNTLDAIRVLQDHWRAHLLAKKVQEEYVCLRKAAVTVQAFYRGHCIRRRLALEHAAATTIVAVVRQFIARKRYMSLKKAAFVLQRRFRATKSCQEETLKYHVTRGACITLQAAVRGFLARKALKKSNRAATVIQSAYRSFRQQQKYNHNRMMIILLQTKIRAYQAGKKVRQEYYALKSATLVVQCMYRGLMARRLATQHRAARCIQSTFRMHLSRQMYLKQRSSAVKIQALCRMYLAKKSYKKAYYAVCVLQKHSRGYLETRKMRRNYVEKKNSAIIIQSHLRRCIAERRYHKHRQAAICIQSHYRRIVQRCRYQTIRDAALVIQRRYRATIIMQETQQEYHMARGAAMTIQAVFRGHMQCCRYRKLRYHVIKMQARARGAMARRCFAGMMREKEAAVCIQRHVRGYQTRKILEAQRQARLRALQSFADRTKAHLSVIRLQRAFRNFRLCQAFKQKMDAITTIQSWMRAKLQRLQFQKIRSATCILQRSARRYLIKKNVAATQLQSVARVWLAKRRVQKMHSAALKLQALWRGHRVRCNIKSKKVNAARARCKRANRNVTEEKKLCNRTATALDYLLHYKSMHRILETLISLEVVSRLSAICCQRLVEAGAVPVLYTLIRGCNRSVPCMEMIEIIVKIFMNIAKHESTHHAVLDVEDSVTTLVELLQIYREKNALIFCKTCVILGKLLQNATQAKIILSYPKTKEKIASLHKLTSRKHAIDERRIKTKSLNASSSFLGTSFNTSSMASASFCAGTPRKRRKVLALAGAEWNIDNPMRAIDFLKLMANRV